MKLRLLLSTLLAVPWLPANATGFDYDIFIVACTGNSCQRVATQTVSGSPANGIEYSRNGLLLNIETLGSRLHEVDARVSMRYQPADDASSHGQHGAEKPALRHQAIVIPVILKQGVFTSLSTFSGDGTFYQVWARLAALR